MKKLISLIFIILLLVSCTNRQEEPVINEPEPVTNEPEPVIVTEKVYVLPDNWIVYDFDFKDDLVTYELKDGLNLTFKGQERQEP